MTILVDGSAAIDIEQLETRIEKDISHTAFGPVVGGNIIKGSFKLPRWCSGFSPHGVNTHNRDLIIITELIDKPGRIFYLLGCHIVSERIDSYGSHFDFIAEHIRRELI